MGTKIRKSRTEVRALVSRMKSKGWEKVSEISNGATLTIVLAKEDKAIKLELSPNGWFSSDIIL